MSKKSRSKQSKKAKKTFKQKFTTVEIQKWINQNMVFKFIGAFFLLLILFYWLYGSEFFEEYFLSNIIVVQAKISSFLLNILGFETMVNGDLISNATDSIVVKRGCDGIEPIALFSIGVLLVPFSKRVKLYGILYGVVILFLLNILRLVALFLIKIYFPTLFEPLHIHGGYAIFMIITILVWLSWARWAFQQPQ